jgi:hypothetical protein
MVVRLSYEEFGCQVPEDPFREWEPLNKAMKTYEVSENSQKILRNIENKNNKTEIT